MKTFEKMESSVRSYSRAFPAVFNRAEGPFLYDEEGNRYLDFLCGAGSLNYGHNQPALQEKLIEYVQSNGIVHGLDMASTAKKHFLETFQRNILFPREMNHKVQFSGPTGTNAVEAAFKLARKVTGRTNIISFTNGFHGVTMGSVAATGNSFFRDGAGTSLPNTSFMPFDGYFGKETDTIEYLRKFIEDSSSGVDLPAAVIVETIQGEGGVNMASDEWLCALENLCRGAGILLIVDDIQMGCGRTGSFFSFEEAAITPDLIVLSKSLSGFGLPFSVVLMKPELDQWEPGEHNGTFRGNNFAFVTAAETLKRWWGRETIRDSIRAKGGQMLAELENIADEFSDLKLSARGKGMVAALECPDGETAEWIRLRAFEKKMIIETCGSNDQVIKFLPSLLIDEETLMAGIQIIRDCAAAASNNRELVNNIASKE